MNDEHQAFLRYDNDPGFAKDLAEMYGLDAEDMGMPR